MRRHFMFVLLVLSLTLLGCGVLDRVTERLTGGPSSAEALPDNQVPSPVLLVDVKSAWRYWAKDGTPDPAWRQDSFDDSGWKQGRLPLGTTKGVQTATPKTDSNVIFLRTEFEAADPAAWQALTLTMDYEDGAAVYLNGTEITRANLAPDAGPQGAAQGEHDTPPDQFDVTGALESLKPGRNTLAVEVHPSESSSRVPIGLTLQAGPKTDIAHFVAGPILGSVDATGVTIKAESDISAASIVEFSPSGGITKTAVAAPATSHRVVLGDLSPGTTYSYRFGLRSGPGVTWSPVGRWTTDGGPTQSIRIAIWGDSRPKTGSSMPAVFGQLLDVMQKRGPLQLAISVGDNVQLSKGGQDDVTIRNRYLGFLHSIEPLAGQVPFYSAIGNHDEPGCQPCLAGFRQYFALPDQNDQTYYSFDYGPAHFVVLNSRQQKGSTVQAISDQQWTWLQQDLSKASRPVKFVFLHDSIYHEAKEEDPSFTPAEIDRLHQLFLQSKVTAVFAGHSHYYDYYERDGIAYMITGGAGSPLYEQFINPAWQRNEALVVQATARQVVIDALLPDGSELDHRTIGVR